MRWDDGPWIPVNGDDDQVPEFRDEMHSGVAGLAHALAELRLARPWTEVEQALADGIAVRLRRGIPTETDPTFFVGLPSALGGLRALGLEAPEATDRLRGARRRRRLAAVPRRGAEPTDRCSHSTT